MRENPVTEISTLAADESLAYVREVDQIDAEIAHLYDADGDDPRVRRARARAHHRLGIALKLAGIHADLAVAEQLAGLRADLAGPVEDGPRRVTFDPAPSRGYGGDDDLALARAAGVVFQED